MESTTILLMPRWLVLADSQSWLTGVRQCISSIDRSSYGAFTCLGLIRLDQHSAKHSPNYSVSIGTQILMYNNDCAENVLTPEISNQSGCQMQTCASANAALGSLFSPSMRCCSAQHRRRNTVPWTCYMANKLDQLLRRGALQGPLQRLQRPRRSSQRACHTRRCCHQLCSWQRRRLPRLLPFLLPGPPDTS